MIHKRMWRDVVITENQFGLILGRSTIEVIHLIRRLVEHYENPFIEEV